MDLTIKFFWALSNPNIIVKEKREENKPNQNGSEVVDCSKTNNASNNRIQYSSVIGMSWLLYSNSYTEA